jgi:hypothetical protein
MHLQIMLSWHTLVCFGKVTEPGQCWQIAQASES